MARTLALITLVTLGVASSYAGPLGINPGNTLNPDGSVSVGLLANSGVKNAGGVGLGTTAQSTTSADGLYGTRVTQGSYYSQTQILSGGQIDNPPLLPQTATSWATTNCAQTGTTGNCQQSLYSPAGAPTFNLLGDNIFADRTLTSQMWITTSTGTATGSTSSLTIPIGIFGVSNVATLLNTTGGVTSGGTVCTTSAGAAQGQGPTGCTNTKSYAYIQFAFQSQADFDAHSTENIQYETLALINGVTQRNILGGFGGYASTTSASYVAEDITGFGASAGATYNVITGNEWNGKISTAGSGAPVNTTMDLDYQIFPIFSGYQDKVLVSATIFNNGTMSGPTFSEEVLSGMTLNLAAASTATPEPSTIALGLSGMGLIGFVRIRRRRRNAK